MDKYTGTIPRRSSRENKGKKPVRLGFESTNKSKKSAEETLIDVQIEKAELELSLLKIKAKEAQLLRESGQSPIVEEKDTVIQQYLQRPVQQPGNVHQEVKDDKVDDEGGASGGIDTRFLKDEVGSVSTDYTRFKGGLKWLYRDSEESDIERESEDSDSMSGSSGRSDIAAAIRAQSEKMNKFMSRQTLGKDYFHFDGNFQEYPMFMAWFSSTTASCKFADQENLLRLQKCLKGEARNAVRFMLYSPECIDEILRTLEKKFGRPEFLVKAMIAEVREIPTVREEKPETVINMATTVLNLVASLKMSNRRNYIDNPQLLEELLGKLPLSLRVQWSEYASKKSHCTLETFSKWMDRRAEAASERVQFYPVKDAKNDKDRKRDKKQKFVAATSEVKNDAIGSIGCVCVCCGGCHDLTSCGDFKKLSVDDRWKLVTEKRM